MVRQSFLVSATVMVLLLGVTARSQEPAPPRVLDETEAIAVRKKAIKLLESVAGQLGSLRSAENRARIGSNVADLIWDHDEQRSRTILTALQDDIRMGFSDPDPGLDDRGQATTAAVFSHLRGNIVERIARRDPEFALQFLRATRPPPDPGRRELTYAEKDLELRLAGQIVDKTPKLALKLGLESLAKGISSEVGRVLSHLQRKDKDAALTFFKAIVDKLRNTNLAQDPQATDLAVRVASSFQPPEADEQTYRDLIGVLLESALANGCAKPPAEDDHYYFCSEIGSVFPRIEKYYGSRATSLRRWAPEENRGMSPGVYREAEEMIQEGTVDEILAMASKYPELKGRLYWSAVSKAKSTGDVARARQIAADVPDEGQRRYLLADLDRDQKWTSTSQEKLADIQQELAGLRTPQERMQFLVHVASLNGDKDRKMALMLLDQVGQMLTTAKPGTDQVGGQIVLAIMYSSLRSDRGFAIMEALIPKFNELIAAAAVLDGFEKSYLRDGEWTMDASSMIGAMLTFLAQYAGYFAAHDFDRSAALVAQFERPEIRLMAELKIAQGVLSKPIPRPGIPAVIR